MFFKKNVLLNVTGMSIIEILIVSAIMSVMGLGFATMISNMNLQQNGLQFRTDGTNFNEEIRSLLSNKQACTNTFGGLNASSLPSAQISNFKDSNNKIVYQIGGTYGDNHSIILSTSKLAAFVNGAAPATGQSTLQNSFAFAKQMQGPVVIPRSIILALELDNSGDISSCVALANMTDGLWQRTSANLNNIQYVAGNVGIGTTDPLGSLQVEGINGVILNSGMVAIGTPNIPYGVNSTLSIATDKTYGNGGVVIGRKADGYAGVVSAPHNGMVVQGPVGIGISTIPYGVDSTLSIATDNVYNFGGVVIGRKADGYAGVVSAPTNGLLVEGPIGIGVTAIPYGVNSTLSVATDNTYNFGGVIIGRKADGYAGVASAPINGLAVEGMVGIGINTIPWGVNSTLAIATDKTYGNGGVVIGKKASGYSGVISAPPNGLAVEGSIGVGVKSPAYPLDVYNAFTGATVANFQSGSASCKITPSVGLACSSDLRLKENVAEITDALERLLVLRGVTFQWKDRTPNDRWQHFGFIAQEVERQFPELVSEDKEGLKSVTYPNFVPVIAEALKEFYSSWKSDSNELHLKVLKYKRENDELRERIDKLEKTVALRQPQENNLPH